MSDFDKELVSAMLKAKEIGVKMLASDCEEILQAAKQSMQGEAVEPSGYTDVETINRWHRLRGTDYESVERGYLPFSSKPFKTDETDCTTAVWLSPPSASAEIARLTKELEEARKVPDGYALVPIEPTQGMLDAVFVNDLDWSDTFAPSENDRRLVYKAMLSAAPDASLNIKGGAE